jgi:hypothetical protein
MAKISPTFVISALKICSLTPWGYTFPAVPQLVTYCLLFAFCINIDQKPMHYLGGFDRHSSISVTIILHKDYIIVLNIDNQSCP